MGQEGGGPRVPYNRDRLRCEIPETVRTGPTESPDGQTFFYGPGQRRARAQRIRSQPDARVVSEGAAGHRRAIGVVATNRLLDEAPAELRSGQALDRPEWPLSAGSGRRPIAIDAGDIDAG